MDSYYSIIIIGLILYGNKYMIMIFLCYIFHNLIKNVQNSTNELDKKNEEHHNITIKSPIKKHKDHNSLSSFINENLDLLSHDIIKKRDLINKINSFIKTYEEMKYISPQKNKDQMYNILIIKRDEIIEVFNSFNLSIPLSRETIHKYNNSKNILNMTLKKYINKVIKNERISAIEIYKNNVIL